MRSRRIEKAITVGKASRIGHGVSIAFEPNVLELVKVMRKRNVSVEICLTSNAMLLGVHGKDHPFRFYRNQGIAVSLNTDDQGILR